MQLKQTQTPWVRFVQTALALFSREDSVGTLQEVPASLGGRNILLCSQTHFIKLRSRPEGDVFREQSALEYLPDGLAPRCLGLLSHQALLEEALRQKDIKSIGQLDLPVGDGIVLEYIQGKPVEPPFTDAQMEKIAQSILQLHSHSPERFPSLQFPYRPGALLRVIRDLYRELQHRGLLHPTILKVLKKAIQQLTKIEESLPGKWPRIRQLCHGDLRWHNLLWNEKGEICLVDFEDAGLGDPAVDLAMMACRTPLSWFDELRLLETYTWHNPDKAFTDRYFAIRPFVGMMCSLAGILDLSDIYEGYRPTSRSAQEHVLSRQDALADELEDALKRILAPGTEIPHTTFHWSTTDQPFSDGEQVRSDNSRNTDKTKELGMIAVDGTGASFKSPFASTLAAYLGIPYYNKGALYRYVALWAHCNQCSPDSLEAQRKVARHLQEMVLTWQEDGSLHINSGQFAKSLLFQVVEEEVAAWAKLPIIRNALSPYFEDILAQPAAVLEGRDVGTTLAPDANYKFYVDATLASRAKTLAKRAGLTVKEARHLLAQRDALDKQRETSPLQMAPDAIQLKLNGKNWERMAEKYAMHISQGQKHHSKNKKALKSSVSGKEGE